MKDKKRMVFAILTTCVAFGGFAGTRFGDWKERLPEPVPDAYRKLWNAQVNAGIDERIEKYRKADWSGAGFPAGAEVKVEQLTHAFQFGSHIFNFDQLGCDDWNAQYRATFTNLWSAATVSFYWDKMEVREGDVRYAAGPRDSAAFWKSVKDLSAKDKWERYPEYRRPAPDPVLDFHRRRWRLLSPATARR